LKRCEVGLADDNNFIFAKPSSEHVLRGSDCLHKLAIEAGANDPASLTSTRLRKLLATTSQVLNLQECELDLLAGFLGHDLLLHRNFYRLQQDTLQLAKVSKILIVYDSGQTSSYKGKTLDEIPVEGDILDIDEENSDGAIVPPKDDDDGSSLPAKCSRSSKRSATPESLPTKRSRSSRPLVIDTDSDVERQVEDENDTNCEGHEGNTVVITNVTI